jgi:hypothetical protein
LADIQLEGDLTLYTFLSAWILNNNIHLKMITESMFMKLNFCSSMEYFRLEREKSGHGYRDVDGNPCFLNIKETGIPRLVAILSGSHNSSKSQGGSCIANESQIISKISFHYAHRYHKGHRIRARSCAGQMGIQDKKNQRGTLELTAATFGFGACLRKVCIGW